MADDRLKSHVLSRADEDTALGDDAKLFVLAALGDAGDLAQVIDDEQTRPELVASLSTAAENTVAPVGAYLKSITVQGFRGIGPAVTVPLQPGPGLIVIAGRNGSGKSTLAEALELALTGSNSRWQGRGPVWSQNWRNLHAGEPAQIRIDIAEEGSGTTTIGVDWPAGADVGVDQLKTWVQRAGQKREPVETLGWSAALEMYRPLLSYDELGHILEGKPSEFYDQLHKLLGLEQLTTAIRRLEAAVKQLGEPAAEVKQARDALKPLLESHQDPRAATALTQLKKTKPDPGAVRPLITGGAATATPGAWPQAADLTTPTAAEIAETVAALRSALGDEQDATRNADALAADRAQLLEQGLAFHDRHGDQLCPVCGQGSLDASWAAAARTALEQERNAARALTAARTATGQARTALLGLVRGLAQPPTADAKLTTLAAAREAYDRFGKLPVNDDSALADHVEETFPELESRYAALRQEAADLIRQRQSAWEPVALQLAEWVRRVEAAARAKPQHSAASQALKWLRDNADRLRNERIAPLADEAKQIWSALRQESNVDLGAIRLEGQNTTRRVELRAAVDGAETEAFSVMSQGELQALALAVFIPRATSEQSPFRFVVLDDPIQAMDPSKIDGFLQVLTALAAHRQVIVLTHDDRLPSAIRTSRAQARIVEVSRGLNSSVYVDESSDPATRLLEDAFAIAADDAVPDDVKRLAVPRLCREAVEVAAFDAFAARALAQGMSRTEIESAWEQATKVNKRLALALALDADDDAAVDKWRQGGSARRNTILAVNKGAHQGVADFKTAVNDARLAVKDLAGLATVAR